MRLLVVVLLLMAATVFCFSPSSFSGKKMSLRPGVTQKSHALDMSIDSDILSPLTSKRLSFGLGRLAFSGLPLSPESVGRRKTIKTEVVKGTIWTLDQVQGIINVNVPVRCQIIKLSAGGLFVNNPIAPTPEAIELVREIEQQTGEEVKYIALSTLGIEHKGTTGSFSSFFPKSEVYLQPGQYSFPINLPSQLFFPFGKTVKPLPEDDSSCPWKCDIDHLSLGPLTPPGVGGFAETAFFHRSTGTLLVTDTIVSIQDEPPQIIQEDPRALLYHARQDMFEIVSDSPANRRKGWRRMVLFGLTFQPKGIEILDTLDSIRKCKNVTAEMKQLGEGAVPFDGGFYPWKWVEDDLPSFRALQGGLLVAPILQKLILNREPEKVLAWADAVSKWPIKRIIPCHLENDVRASSAEFRRAFNFLEKKKTNKAKNAGGGLPGFDLFGFSFGKEKRKRKRKIGERDKSNSNNSKPRGERPAPVGLAGDVALLEGASATLTEQGVLYPEASLVER